MALVAVVQTSVGSALHSAILAWRPVFTWRRPQSTARSWPGHELGLVRPLHCVVPSRADCRGTMGHPERGLGRTKDDRVDYEEIRRTVIVAVFSDPFLSER